MSGSLQIKGNYYYIVHPYKNINNETKYNWVATKCHIKDGKKAAKAVLEKWKIEHAGCDMAYIKLLFADYQKDF